jgi:hypothetical protein
MGLLKGKFFKEFCWEFLGIFFFKGRSGYKHPQNNYLMGVKK